MRRTIVHGIIILLASTLVTTLALEEALQIFDPWGMHYFDDLATIWNNSIMDAQRGRVLPPGTYHLTHWTVTELPGYIRLTPNNQNGPCKVVFIGDSLTWGHGVDDQYPWVNLLAAQLPGTTVINAGFDGYNSTEVLQSMVGFPDANLFVYFISGNDAEKPIGLFKQNYVSMLKKYQIYISSSIAAARDGAPSAPEDMDQFYADLDKMVQDGRVIFVGLDEEFIRGIKPIYPVTRIPFYTHSNSRVDAHPNPQGHQEIAVALLPTVKEAVAQHCPPK